MTLTNDQIEQLAVILKDFALERNWQQFHSPKNLVMALVGEAGELAEQFQWLTEQQSYIDENDVQKRDEVAQEIADIFLYLVRLSDVLNIDLMAAAQRKIAINRQKYPIDSCYGVSTKYTKL